MEHLALRDVCVTVYNFVCIQFWNSVSNCLAEESFGWILWIGICPT